MIIRGPGAGDDPPVEGVFDLSRGRGDEPPAVDHVFDLSARRTAKTLQEENATLKERIAELQVLVDRGPLDQTKSHGGDDAQPSECKYHLSVLVDESTLTVTCRHCKAKLDPFVVLNEFAKKERQFATQTKWKIDERKALSTEIAQLTKERARLRSQVSYARKTLSEVRAQGGHLPPDAPEDPESA
jgi:uncharacterized protein YlxW (UPF0749 family)